MNKKFSSAEARLFLLCVGLELGLTLFYIIHRIIPGGHDGFGYFALQYYYLNNKVIYGEAPQWIPFVTHGTMLPWLATIHAGLLQNILLSSPVNFLKNINFIPIFHWGIFIDKLLLLTGTWFLARRFFRSAITIFFVTMTVMLSCVWMTQPWFNFHAYYAIPLILYFGHLFLERGEWRYFFLSGNLLLFQLIGKPPYLFPVISLICFLYFFFYAFFNWKEVYPRLTAIRQWRRGVAVLICLGGMALGLFWFMRWGADAIVSYNVGRNADNTVTLDGFLHYGGHTGMAEWLQMLKGVSSNIDYTLYIGILPLPLILLGLLRGNRQKRHFAALSLVLFLFSGGGAVASFFYYAWPLMKYYRHLYLIRPFVKMFFCFLAGFGLESVLQQDGPPSPKTRKVLLWTIGGILLIVGVFLYTRPAQGLFLVSTIKNFDWRVLRFPGYFRATRTPEYLYHRYVLLAPFLLLMTGGVVWLVLCPDAARRTRWVKVVLAAHALNLLIYNALETSTRTRSLQDPQQYAVTRFQPFAFPVRRQADDTKLTPRTKFVAGLRLDPTTYWTLDAFLFRDQAGNAYRTDYWLRPLDQLMRAFWGQDIHDTARFPKGLEPYKGLTFPASSPAARNIAGIDRDKIQFFTRASFLKDTDAVARQITRPDYQGNQLFLLGPDDQENDRPLPVDTRVDFPYEITSFSSNSLEFKVHVPRNVPTAWVFYSDVWHPFWRATVNGKEQEVLRANLAYKAVPLETGENTVHFYFNSRLLSIIQWFIAINSLVWAGIVIGMMAKSFPEKIYNDKGFSV